MQKDTFKPAQSKIDTLNSNEELLKRVKAVSETTTHQARQDALGGNVKAT